MIKLISLITDFFGIENTENAIKVKCENCKHWKQETAIGGTCIEMSECGGNAEFDISVESHDCESITVSTHKDFGCALFESNTVEIKGQEISKIIQH